MGCFDDVHGGWQCGQVKGLGKVSGDIFPGDSVQLIPAPMDDAEYKLYLRGEPLVRPERDFLLIMSEGGYITVRDGIFVEWAVSADLALPVFNSLGLAFTGLRRPASSRAVSVEAGECAACSAVRDGSADDYRTKRSAAMRAARAQFRAQRRRSAFRSV
jgi:hypothetical protein